MGRTLWSDAFDSRFPLNKGYEQTKSVCGAGALARLFLTVFSLGGKNKPVSKASDRSVRPTRLMTND